MPPEFFNLPPHPRATQQLAGGGMIGGEGGAVDVTGPLGANIFVFHVPNDWRKDDLAAYFAPFGYILSAKVAMDRSSGRNKGYGFVSYDSVRSALQAVQQMNLVSVGNKRLRVAIKNGEEGYARQYAAQEGLSIYPPALGKAVPLGQQQQPNVGGGRMLGDRLEGSSIHGSSPQEQQQSYRRFPQQQQHHVGDGGVLPQLHSGHHTAPPVSQFVAATGQQQRGGGRMSGTLVGHHQTNLTDFRNHPTNAPSVPLALRNSMHTPFAVPGGIDVSGGYYRRRSSGQR